MHDKRDRSNSAQKKDDSNKWYIQIYNLPEHFNKEDIVYFIWKALQKCRALKKATNPITRSEYLQQLKCIRLFFRSKDQTLNCLDLNGILYGQKSFYMKSPLRTRDHPLIQGKNLQIKRLHSKVEDGFNKLCIQNLPTIPEHQVVNILRNYGQLKGFQAIYSDKILSHCFCQYQSNQQTQECIAKLNNFKIKSKNISVKRAAMAKQPIIKSTITKVKGKTSLFEKDPHSFYLTFDSVGYFKAMKISCVLLLRNIVSNQNQKEFVKADIKKEVEKIGKITKYVNKEKNIYVQFQKIQIAQIAFLLLMNRKYEGKNIDVAFYDPINFADDILI